MSKLHFPTRRLLVVVGGCWGFFDTGTLLFLRATNPKCFHRREIEEIQRIQIQGRGGGGRKEGYKSW